MPNHIHAIFIVENTNRQEQSPCPTIMDIVCAYKSITTKLCNKNYGVNGSTIWQKSFHDHIIRNEVEYLKIWEYIDTNPLKWEDDCYYTLDNTPE
jgi:putative transposase